MKSILSIFPILLTCFFQHAASFAPGGLLSFQTRCQCSHGGGNNKIVSYCAANTNQKMSQQERRRPFTAKMMIVMMMSTLTPDTTWRIRFVLRGAPTEQGKKVDQLSFVWNVQFKEDEDYEPPQGTLVQLPTISTTSQKDQEASNSNSNSVLQIIKSRWKLSEDPNERRDGLWVWGLFKEPMYPFLLLQVETDRWNLPNSDDAILPLKLFAQVKHRRDKERGVTLDNAEWSIRQMETVNADPFGAASVDVFEEVSVGQVSFLPTTTTVTP